MKTRMFWNMATRTALGGASLVALLAGGSACLAQGDPPPAPLSAEGVPVAPVQSLPADLSPGLDEIVKLSQANVGDEVILAYVKKSGSGYNVTANDILYLNDIGVSQTVLNALIQSRSSAPVAAPPPPPPVEQAPPPPVVEVVPPPPADVTVDYFYDDLAPYGTWVNVVDVGLCWRPAVAVVTPEWRPYWDRGHWVYSDSGWYWASDYSWGWAPFHYGRWHHDGRFGWVWRPGSVWGPAWVTWREADGYCGWAPLPPTARFEAGVGFMFRGGHVGFDFDFGLHDDAFCFVEYGHFWERDYHRYGVPHDRVHTVFSHSTVINNITVVNNRVVNEGIRRDHIAQVTHKAVQPIKLRDVSAPNSARGGRGGGGGALAVYRPAPNVITAPKPVSPGRGMLINHGDTTRWTSPAIPPFRSPAPGPGRNTAAEPMRGPATEPLHSTAAEPIRSPATGPIRGAAAEPIRGPATSPTRGAVTEPPRGTAAGPIRGTAASPIGSTAAAPIGSTAVPPMTSAPGPGPGAIGTYHSPDVSKGHGGNVPTAPATPSKGVLPGRGPRGAQSSTDATLDLGGPGSSAPGNGSVGRGAGATPGPVGVGANARATQPNDSRFGASYGAGASTPGARNNGNTAPGYSPGAWAAPATPSYSTPQKGGQVLTSHGNSAPGQKQQK